MYLAELKLRNFRKYGEISSSDALCPGLHLHFRSHLNLLVGENDSGKSAVIDAIKYILQTHSYDPVRFSVDDFYLPDNCSKESERARRAEIECIFRGFELSEAKNFLEWLAIDENGYWLRIIGVATRVDRRVTFDVKAGLGEGSYLNEGARDLLRITYLKPLRDAETELAPRKGSRISQILDRHEAFTEKDDHELLKIVSGANKQIEQFFKDGSSGNGLGKRLHEDIDTYLGEFSDKHSPLSSRFSIAEMRLRSILERLKLSVVEAGRTGSELDIYPGLGSHNLLFIAAELLLLKKAGYDGLRLALIEEIEAHLHPQAQLRLIEYLQQQAQTSDIQLILTTHSPILASKISLDSLIICRGSQTYPMGSNWTKLEDGDYRFLERFLDSTKANLFFAKGVILVEGDAENILIPVIAEIIGYPLSQYGVSIVNVGSTAFLRYARVFQRRTGTEMGIRVAVVTDLDIRPDEYKREKADAKTWSEFDVTREHQKKIERFDGQGVQTFVSPYWTLEYCIARSAELRIVLLKAIECAQLEGKQNGVTNENLANIEAKIEEEIASFLRNGCSDNEIAFQIYYHKLLKQQVSKAITAQWLARFLAEGSSITHTVLISDPNIAYLIDAIKYAANAPSFQP